MAVLTDSPASHDRRLAMAFAAREAFSATWAPIDAERNRARRAMLNKQRIAVRVPYHEWQAALAADELPAAAGKLELLVLRYAVRRHGGPHVPSAVAFPPDVPASCAA